MEIKSHKYTTTTKLVQAREEKNALFNALHAAHIIPVRPIDTADGPGNVVYE